jgi:hypothetical protein
MYLQFSQRNGESLPQAWTHYKFLHYCLLPFLCGSHIMELPHWVVMIYLPYLYLLIFVPCYSTNANRMSMYICTCRVDTFRNSCPCFSWLQECIFLDMYIHINIYIYEFIYNCFGSLESDMLLPNCSSRIPFQNGLLINIYMLCSQVLFPVMRPCFFFFFFFFVFSSYFIAYLVRITGVSWHCCILKFSFTDVYVFNFLLLFPNFKLS